MAGLEDLRQMMGAMAAISGGARALLREGLGFGWESLDKATLSKYVEDNYCQDCSDGALENKTGRFFEEKWHDWAQQSLWRNKYRKNVRKFEGDRNTVPDGIADIIDYEFKMGIPKEKARYKNNAWFEVKAKNGSVYNSTSSNQIKGHLENLSSQGYVKPRLAIVTTSNVQISNSVKVHARAQGINLIHVKAQFKMVNNKMLVRF